MSMLVAYDDYLTKSQNHNNTENVLYIKEIK